MDLVHDRGSMDPVHESGPWTRSKEGVHGPLVHVLSSPGPQSVPYVHARSGKATKVGVCKFLEEEECLVFINGKLV